MEKLLTNFYNSILLIASDLNLCTIKSAFTWLLMHHFNRPGKNTEKQKSGLVRSSEENRIPVFRFSAAKGLKPHIPKYIHPMSACVLKVY